MSHGTLFRHILEKTCIHIIIFTKYYIFLHPTIFIYNVLGIEPRDAILVAIREDYVDGVECLLQYEEDVHKEGDPYTWEKVDQVSNQ